MITPPIIRWGSRHTPLLPRCLFKTYGSHPLPNPPQRRVFPRVTQIGELSSIWQTRKEPITDTEQQYLVELFRAHLPPSETLVVPAGIRAGFLTFCVLSVRTRNCMHYGGLLKRDDGVCVGDLLQIRSFGLRSLLELMCAAEAGLERMYAALSAFEKVEQGEFGSQNSEVPDTSTDGTLLDITGSRPSHTLTVGKWELARNALLNVISTAQDLQVGSNLADALHPSLLEVAAETGYQEALESIPLSAFVDGRLRPSERILTGLEDLCNSMSEQEKRVVELRLCGEDAQTLATVGLDLGITRERVRQLQVRLQNSINARISRDVGTLARLLVARLPATTDAEILDVELARVLTQDESLAAKLARSSLKQALGYTGERGVLLNAEAVQVMELIQLNAREFADDVGLIDRDRLAKTCLPAADWSVHWESLANCAGLRNVGGYLCLRDSAKARVKAGLLKIGEPATKEQISAECGLKPLRVGGAISNIPSIVRADIYRWGLREWIDDEYEGIVGEILQRIREGGGVTSAAWLMRELPEKFGVSPSSVRAYLGTPRFEVYKDEVREAISPSYELQSLEDVIDGRDAEGSALWKFSVEDRYFAGYSLAGVPYEIAAALGCPPGDSIRVPLAEPHGCRAISISWPLASSTKASIGYLSDALTQLDVVAGDTVSLVIKKEGFPEIRPVDEQPRTDSAASLLERIKNRRRVL